MHMLEDGYDVSTTMIYAPVLNRALSGFRIPVDGLEFKNPQFRRINLIIVGSQREYLNEKSPCASTLPRMLPV